MYKLKYINGHIYAEIDGHDWLIDTGSPSSFGKINTLKITNKIFSIQPSLLNLNSVTLSQYVEHDIVGLLGTDILNEFNIVFDIKNQHINFSLDKIDLDGEVLDIDGIMGIPVVTSIINDNKSRMFFDTGAQISYIQKEDLAHYDLLETVTDFYPGVGQFETVTAVVDLKLGSLKYKLKCGSLPDMLNMTLMMTNTDGIIGNETMLDSVVGYFPQENKLVFKNNSDASTDNFAKTNTFESLCKLASREDWCWNLTCTTCGNMHFRYGFIELANLKSPESRDWLVHRKTSRYKKVGKFPRSYSFDQKNIIHEICMQANLTNIYNNCTHPTWLGYLGLILAHMKNDSDSFKALSISWASQLERMVYEHSSISVKLKQIAKGNGLLSIEDLESCEYNFDTNGVAYE